MYVSALYDRTTRLPHINSVPYTPAASENQPSAYSKAKAQISCAVTAGFLVMRRLIIMVGMESIETSDR